MIKEILNKLSRKEDLSNQEMQDVVNHIMCGEVEDNDIESFLLALNEKGIQEPEITAAATVMREKSLKFDIGDGTHIDTCGTGGTGLHTFNCSTASSFVAAAGGASITKHGNKAISSKSGSADFLTEAGADITHDRNKLLNVFNQVGFIFPCGARRQIIGVYDNSLLSTFSRVAKNLDMEHVMVVHGEDGLDEISITGPTNVSEYKDFKINEYAICPEDFGIASAPFEDIAAQSSEESLRMVQEAFAGEKSAVQDMIALNSGAALYIARKVDSISEGVELSFDLMNNGKAADKLAAYVRVSNI
ncbi:MAG: anthranilate phosphoribosyltransferase [Proteobacteria bacterium]|nr:anthranilate phosphoribosyltransferase [Pseudomonadota bacterium]